MHEEALTRVHDLLHQTVAHIENIVRNKQSQARRICSRPDGALCSQIHALCDTFAIRVIRCIRVIRVIIVGSCC